MSTRHLDNMVEDLIACNPESPCNPESEKDMTKPLGHPRSPVSQSCAGGIPRLAFTRRRRAKNSFAGRAALPALAK